MPNSFDAQFSGLMMPQPLPIMPPNAGAQAGDMQPPATLDANGRPIAPVIAQQQGVQQIAQQQAALQQAAQQQPIQAAQQAAIQKQKMAQQQLLAKQAAMAQKQAMAQQQLMTKKAAMEQALLLKRQQAQQRQKQPRQTTAWASPQVPIQPGQPSGPMLPPPQAVSLGGNPIGSNAAATGGTAPRPIDGTLSGNAPRPNPNIPAALGGLTSNPNYITR